MISLLICVLVTLSLNFKIGKIPALGKFMSPFQGSWQNAEKDRGSNKMKFNMAGLKSPVEVFYDDRCVPHIFAENEQDLYFAQGFVTAGSRLWQMDFQSRLPSGRLSEVLGERLLPVDRKMRRLGLDFAADEALKFIDSQPKIKTLLRSYVAGVNAYIAQLSPKDYPLEFKLLDYTPENWTLKKIALLQKSMGHNLASWDRDLENTQALELIGRDLFEEVYRMHWPNEEPIVPDFNLDGEAKRDTMSSPIPMIPKWKKEPKPEDNSNTEVGSNNWAVAPSKTKSGNSILANDPHLQLTLPSIWFETHLNCPGQNVYGVTLPGSPGVIIGYNDQIAWGVTNGERDVRDWYKIKFENSTRKKYFHDNQWKEVRQEIQTFKVRGEKDFVDTLLFTHHGPITYDRNFPLEGAESSTPLASQWTLHKPSNEWSTFYALNKAKTYDEYRAALDGFDNPGQNFAFASGTGDIAISHTGKYPILNADESLFLSDGDDPANDWSGYVPKSENPYHKNPERGFVSSANQVPADSLYPYFYSGNFEYYRNRRINKVLGAAAAIDPSSMQNLQNDNQSGLALEVLGRMQELLDEGDISENGEKALQLLEEWNYMNDADLQAPALFEVWWAHVYDAFWAELIHQDKTVDKPEDHTTAQFLIHADRYLKHADVLPVHEKDLKEIVTEGFNEMVSERCVGDWEEDLKWWKEKGTDIKHLARIEAFSIMDVEVGGSRNTVNAITPVTGPSWRMVVEMSSPPKGYGVYPGGQSGNPGSPYYNDQVETWRKGEYYELDASTDLNYWKSKSKKMQILSPL